MENASKALLIAGGVLIAIILISVLVRTYGNISLFQRQKLTEEEIARIEEDNKAYTKYLNQYVYGTEVISVINKAADSKFDVSVKIKFINSYEYTRIAYVNGKRTLKKIKVNAGETIDLENDVELKEFIDQNSENFGTRIDTSETVTNVTGLKNKAFQCDKIGYDNSTGRVNDIHFTEKEIR